MYQHFSITESGNVVLTLADVEVQIFRQMAEELRPVIGDPNEAQGKDPMLWHSDPVRDRLFPRAYSDTKEKEAEDMWQRMVHPDLVSDKLVHLSRVLMKLEPADPQSETFEAELTPDEANAWMGVIQDARIILGFSLDVGEQREEISADDPRAASFAAYDYLTMLQEELVAVLSELL